MIVANEVGRGDPLLYTTVAVYSNIHISTFELASSSNAMEELYLSRMDAWMSPNVYGNDNSNSGLRR